MVGEGEKKEMEKKMIVTTIKVSRSRVIRKTPVKRTFYSLKG